MPEFEVPCPVWKNVRGQNALLPRSALLSLWWWLPANSCRYTHRLRLAFGNGILTSSAAVAALELWRSGRSWPEGKSLQFEVSDIYFLFWNRILWNGVCFGSTQIWRYNCAMSALKTCWKYRHFRIWIVSSDCKTGPVWTTSFKLNWPRIS